MYVAVFVVLRLFDHWKLKFPIPFTVAIASAKHVISVVLTVTSGDSHGSTSAQVICTTSIVSQVSLVTLVIVTS